MKKLVITLSSVLIVILMCSCGNTAAPAPTPTPTPIPVDEVTLTYNTFDVDELLFDIPQYEEKDIIFKSTVKPSAASSLLTVTSSNNDVAEIVPVEEGIYKLVLKSAGEVTVTAACGELSKSIDITVTNLPKAEKALLLTSETITADSTSVAVYSYDENNLRTLKEVTSTSTDGTTEKGTVTYTYNDMGLLLCEKLSTGLSTQFEYDDQGNETLQLATVSGNVYYKEMMEYDTNGHKTSEKIYVGAKFAEDTTFFYDENGVLTQEEHRMFPDVLNDTKVVVYAYNKDGNIIKITSTDTLVVDEQNKDMDIVNVTVTERFYDENGWFIREEELGDYDESPKVVEYKYDVYGNLISETTTNPNATDDEKPYVRFEYEIDEYGNYIVQRTYYDEAAKEPDSVINNTWKMVAA